MVNPQTLVITLIIVGTVSIGYAIFVKWASGG
jgi:hypothetical protein